MKKRILLVITLFLHLMLAAQQKWDLRKCVEYALENNISIQQQEIQARFSALALKQSKLTTYPSLGFNTNTGLQFGRSVDPTTNQFTTTQLLFQGFNLSTDVVIYNWNRVKNSMIAANLEQQASREDVETVKNNIALTVATSFLSALLNKEQIQIAQVQFEQTKSQLEATKSRVSAGDLPELNAAELEAQLARDSAAVINAKAMAEISVLQLKALLNVDAASEFDIEAPPVDRIPVESIAALQPEYVFEMALQNQPAQKANATRLRSLEAMAKASKAGMYPTLTAFGGLGTNFANPFKKVTGYQFVGYQPISAFAPVVNVNGTNYPVQSPDIAVSQGKKSFSEIWSGWGTQVKNNFRQNIGIAISVPIFNGGAARAGYERARLNVENAKMVIKQADQTLKQDIYTAYANASSSLQKFNASETTLTTSRKAYDFATKRYELGLLSTFELITSQNNLAKAMLDQLLAKYEYVFRMKVLEFYKGQGLKL